MAARCYATRRAGNWATDHQSDVSEVVMLARRAIERGHDDAIALATAGFALADVADDVLGGDVVIERALALNPNLASAWLFSGWGKISMGQPDLAIERVTRAMRLNPHDPNSFSMKCAL